MIKLIFILLNNKNIYKNLFRNELIIYLYWIILILYKLLLDIVKESYLFLEENNFMKYYFLYFNNKFERYIKVILSNFRLFFLF